MLAKSFSLYFIPIQKYYFFFILSIKSKFLLIKEFY